MEQDGILKLMVERCFDYRLLEMLVDGVMRVASTIPAILETARMDLGDLVFEEAGIRDFAIGVSTTGNTYHRVLHRHVDDLSAIAHLTTDFPELLNVGLLMAGLVGFGSMSNPRQPGSVRTLNLRIDDDFQVPDHDLAYTLTYSIEDGALEFHDLIEYDWPASAEKRIRRLVRKLDCD